MVDFPDRCFFNENNTQSEKTGTITVFFNVMYISVILLRFTSKELNGSSDICYFISLFCTL